MVRCFGFGEKDDKKAFSDFKRCARWSSVELFRLKCAVRGVFVLKILRISSFKLREFA